MENIKEIRILTYSLELVGNFSDRVDSVNSSDEFLKIHKRNIDSLINLSKERNTDYFLSKIKEYPEFTETELDEFIRLKKKDQSLLSVFGGHLLGLIEWIFRIVKTRGNNLGNTEKKLRELKSLNDSIMYVVQNPGFEELIKNRNNTYSITSRAREAPAGGAGERHPFKIGSQKNMITNLILECK